MSQQNHLYVSLFELAREALNDDDAILQCSKVTLVHVSHTLEDIVLQNGLKALMFTGFQESSHWRQETQRYIQLTQTAEQVTIFAGKPIHDPHLVDAIQVTLDGEDPLRQEWFMLILSEKFSVLLCGKDNLKVTDEESLRQFDTILNFDPEVLDAITDRLETVLERYRPDLLPRLRAMRDLSPSWSMDLRLITHLMTDFVRFEEQLNYRLAAMRDEQRRISTDLRRERDYNDKLIRNTPAYLLTLDVNGRVLMMNDLLLKHLAVDLPDVVGKRFSECWIPEAERDLFEALHARTLLNDGETVIGETYLIVNPEFDTQHYVEWRCNLIEDGPVVFMIGHDLTDRVRVQELLRDDERLRIELEKERELSGVRNAFMTTVSHEFRTPLATILTSAELLELYHDALSPVERKRRLTKIKAQVEHLTSMLKDISILVESNSGKLSTKFKLTHPGEWIANIIQDVQMSMRIKNRVDFQDDWDRGAVLIDQRFIKHIVSNLVNNALKYSPDDSRVNVRLYDDLDRLVITVIDRGIGILEADQQRLFEPFYRGQNVGTIGGTGLGLRIVQECVQLYEGKVTYESGEAGSIFTVVLPVPINP